MPWFPWFRKRANKDAGTARRFAIFGGRRYSSEVPYVLPKDMGEISRLDFQHYMLRYVLHNDYAAPITNGQLKDILDVGSGTGRWAVEMSMQFPQANIFSLDIEPPQTVQSTVLLKQPDNCIFVQGNVLQGLPFPDNSFDFVHQRLLVAALPYAQWGWVVRELLRVTRPGGWIELIEAPPAPKGGKGLLALNDWMVQITSRRGINAYISLEIGDLLRQAGLQDVVYRELPIPIGQHGKRLGLMAEANLISLLRGMKGLIVSQGVTDADTYDSMLQLGQTELATGKYMWPYYLAYGRKPIA